MRVLLASALALVAAATSPAADPKVPAAVVGVWTRDAEGMVLRFQFLADGAAKVSVTAGDNGMNATGKFSIDDNNRLKLTLTETKEVGTFPGTPPKGAKFEFVFKPGDKTAALSDFTGEDAEGAKKLVEGEYRRGSEKK